MAKTRNNKSTEKSHIWGGRFDDGVGEAMEQINVSIDYDRHLFRQDIAASRAHAEMLAKQKIINAADAAAISEGLVEIEHEIAEGRFTFSRALEDIHMNIEARLISLIGDAGGRLHTARSRNDQVATDLRLWIRESCDAFDEKLKALQHTLIEQAEEHVETLMPGYTHLQPAQPVTFGHHLMAYVEMFDRDRGRFADARRRLNFSPLGAAALAGTSFPIDREMTAKALGFEAPMRNSMDAVAARDFVIEALSAMTICTVHLSRLAEEIILWSSPGFGFIRLSDAFSTGSSIMPQKRNPDAAELVRAKPGRMIGALITMITVLKALPMTYSKDMQEDKEPVFDASRNLSLALVAMTGMVSDMQVDAAAMRDAIDDGFPTATDLADWLVRVLGLAFREAHHITGEVVALAEKRNLRLDQLSLADLQSVHQGFTIEACTVLDPVHSVASRNSFGGTAPDQVRIAIKTAKKNL